MRSMARYGSRHQAQRRRPEPGTKLNVTTRMTAESYEKAADVAEALGVSISALLNELVERLEVDDRGNPGWTSRYAAPNDEAQERLELSA